MAFLNVATKIAYCLHFVLNQAYEHCCCIALCVTCFVYHLCPYKSTITRIVETSGMIGYNC